MKKACTDCLAEKDIGRFYKYPKGALGVMSVCKTCHKRNVYANRELKAEYYRQQDREIARRPEKVAARRAYSQTPAGKAAHVRANRVYRRFKALEARA
jgi:hypothetical protein